LGHNTAGKVCAFGQELICWCVESLTKNPTRSFHDGGRVTSRRSTIPSLVIAYDRILSDFPHTRQNSSWPKCANLPCGVVTNGGVSKAGYDGRAAEAAFQFRDPIQIFVKRKSTIFRDVPGDFACTGFTVGPHFWSGRDRYCNKLLSSLAKFDVLSWFLGGNQLMRSLAASKSVEDAIQTMRVSDDFLKMSKASHMRTIPNQGGITRSIRDWVNADVIPRMLYMSSRIKGASI